jgi:LPS-assembly lipoprotein
MKRRALLGLLALGPLGGCGWRLRGSSAAPLPFSELALEDRGADVQLYQALTARLNSAGVRVHEQAPLRLVLAQTQWRVSRTALTLTGDTAAEIISLRQPFSLWRQGRLLLTDSAEVYRDHQIDTAALAAAEAQRHSIRQKMRQAAVEQIIRQLHYLQ